MFGAFESIFNSYPLFQVRPEDLGDISDLYCSEKRNNNVTNKHIQMLLHLYNTKFQQKLNSKLITFRTLLVKINRK